MSGADIFTTVIMILLSILYEVNSQSYRGPQYQITLEPSISKLLYTIPMTIETTDGVVTSKQMLLHISSTKTILFSTTACLTNEHHPIASQSCVFGSDLNTNQTKTSQQFQIQYNSASLTCGYCFEYYVKPSLMIGKEQNNKQYSSTTGTILATKIQSRPDGTVGYRPAMSNFFPVTLAESYTFVDLPAIIPKITEFSGILGVASIVIENSSGGEYKKTLIRPSVALQSMGALASKGTSFSTTQTTSPYTPSFGLDIQSLLKNNTIIPATSTLYIDGIPKNYQNSIVWSKRTIRPPTPTSSSNPNSSAASSTQDFLSSSPSFDISNVSFCGSTTTIAMNVVIDTTSPCLSLPNHVFDSLIQSLPLICDTDQNIGPMCYYDRGLYNPKKIVPRALPHLTFTLTKEYAYNSKLNSMNQPIEELTLLRPKLQSNKSSSDKSQSNDDEDGFTTLHLPLSQLVLPLSITNPYYNPRPGYNRVCIQRSNQPYIVFGTLALSAFYVHVTPTAVGIRNKVVTEKELLDSQTITLQKSTGCIEQNLVTCVGQQQIYRDLNICVNPKCDDYFFFVMDPSTFTCKLEISFYVILFVLVGLYILYEFITYCIQKRIEYVIENSTAVLDVKPVYTGGTT